ncbi:MAG: ATP phosphoribosyltransferase regulatory subunit, partial [Christensenellales bacterium]
DYYTKTVFEVISNKIGAQGTICGGGRYDGLVETLGGPKTPGIGFGIGMERLLLVMQAQGAEPPVPSRCDVFVNTFGDTERALEICTLLRARGVKADFDPNKRSMKSAMRYAESWAPPAYCLKGKTARQGEVLIRASRRRAKAIRLAKLDRLQRILAQFTWA